MPRPYFQHEALKSLSKLSRQSTNGRSALFPRPAHVRAQQRRAFQWSGLKSQQLAVSYEENPTDGQNHLAERRINIKRKPTLNIESETQENTLKITQEEEFEENEELEDEAERSQREGNFPLQNAKPFDTSEKAQEAVRDTLARRPPANEVLFVFLRAARSPGYLEFLNDNEPLLKSIVDTIKPSTLLARYRTIYKDINPVSLRHHHRVSSLTEIFNGYTKFFRLFLEHLDKPIPESRRWRLKVMLDLANATGDAQAARRTFRAMRRIRKQDSLDLKSYNTLIDTLCWDRVYDKEPYNLRVTPVKLSIRSTLWRKPGYRVGKGGLREEVLELVQTLQDEDLEANTETWNSTMVALAREGDIEGIKSLLQRIWDVDVDAVMRDAEDGMLFENSLLPESSTFPNERTLFAIVHSFCINNELAVALQVTDFFSRKYEIAIPQVAWDELLEWAYILATSRGGTAKHKEDRKIGKMPFATVEKLWATMSSPPYDLQLNMSRIRLLFKSALRRGALIEALEMIKLADEASQASRLEYQRTKTMKTEVDAVKTLTLEVLDAQQMRDHFMTRQFLRLLLRSPTARRFGFYTDSDQYRDWHHRQIPNLVGTYSRYEPTYGHAYSTHQGRVQFRPVPRSHRKLRVHLSREKSSFPGVVVRQPPRITPSEPWMGLTRQRQLQKGYAEQETVKGPPPKYKPAWFERNDIKDWGIAKEINK